jgi:hypothetical protein
MRNELNQDAVRSVVVAYTRGQITRAEIERALHLAGWQPASITRLLDVADYNLRKDSA